MSTEAVSRKSTRREFLRGAAVAGAASVAAGVSAAPVLAAPVPQKWDRETDVVVVGFGGAGGAAAIEAAAAGAEVLVLERMKQGGGSTNICGGVIYMGGGTPLQKELGFTEDTRDAMYQYVLAAAQAGADPDFIGLYCDKSLELYDWVTKIGIKFNPDFHDRWPDEVKPGYGLYYSGDEQQSDYASIVPPAPRGHTTPNGGKDIFAALQAAVEKSGAEVLYEALGKQLVVDENGRVVGVVADVQGKETSIKARRGVVLTAGGFAANKEMVGRHCPAFLGCVANLGTAGDDGSGIVMGQSAGGDVRMLGEASGFKTISGPQLKGILVNHKGQRYMAEDHYLSWIADAIIKQYPTSYLILDGAIWKEMGEAAQKGAQVVAQGDTLEELAKALKMPAGALESTVALYNQGAEKGSDPLFGKFADYMAPLETAPFYAVDASPKGIVFFTTGGLRTNLDAQVLRPGVEAEPVPGLYAAGRNAFAVTAQEYPGSGTSVAEALTFGRIAGQNVAAEKPAA